MKVSRGRRTRLALNDKRLQVCATHPERVEQHAPYSRHNRAGKLARHRADALPCAVRALCRFKPALCCLHVCWRRAVGHTGQSLRLLLLLLLEGRPATRSIAYGGSHLHRQGVFTKCRICCVLFRFFIKRRGVSECQDCDVGKVQDCVHCPSPTSFKHCSNGGQHHCACVHCRAGGKTLPVKPNKASIVSDDI